MYASRPQMCDAFRCAWLKNANWPDSWRPDRSGLFCLHEQLPGDVPAALVYEIRPDAFAQASAADVFHALRRTAAFVIVVDAKQCRRRLAGDWDRRDRGDVPQRAA